jgi:hypothetical protein
MEESYVSPMQSISLITEPTLHTVQLLTANAVSEPVLNSDNLELHYGFGFSLSPELIFFHILSTKY